jgi:hypothetical protein
MYMEIEKAIAHNFEQLQSVLNGISAAGYTAKPGLLNGASIGEHCRHLLEIFICLDEGYETGIVNYENRRRDKLLEQNKDAAIECMAGLSKKIGKKQKELMLHACYSPDNNKPDTFQSSYYRELAYALEHAVHHMALIRIGVNIVAPDQQLPGNFGVASSTLKYRKLCAQ